MSTALSTTSQGQPTIQPAAVWSEDQIRVLKDSIARGVTNEELALFMSVCQRTKLDPFARQIFPVKRWDSKLGREVMSVQVSIDGFRVISERSGQYAGQLGPQWCGQDGVWHDVWLKAEAPAAARVAILRHDFKEPLWATALWSSYCQTTKDGQPTAMWRKFGPLMLAKCAEALGRRTAFPQDLSGLYAPEEMMQATKPAEVEVLPGPGSSAGEGEPDTPATTGNEKVNAAQVKTLAVLCEKKLGPCDRVVRIAQLNGIIGGRKRIESSKDLTVRQWQKCLDYLNDKQDFVPLNGTRPPDDPEGPDGEHIPPPEYIEDDEVPFPGLKATSIEARIGAAATALSIVNDRGRIGIPTEMRKRYGIAAGIYPTAKELADRPMALNIAADLEALVRERV